MQRDNETAQKDVVIEGVRFTPEMLSDVSVDREKLLSEFCDDPSSAKPTIHRNNLNINKILSFLSTIVGLGFLTFLFFSTDLAALKTASGIAFIILLAGSIRHYFKKDLNKNYLQNLLENFPHKYAGYALLMVLGLIALYFLIMIISKYIVWIILIAIFIAWLKDN